MRFEPRRGPPTAFKSTSRRKSLFMLGMDTSSARLCINLLQSSGRDSVFVETANLLKAVRTRLGERVRRRALFLCLGGRACCRGGWEVSNKCHGSPSVIGHDCCWFLSWEVVKKVNASLVPAYLYCSACEKSPFSTTTTSNMPKALTHRRDRGPAHPYPRPQVPSPRRSRRTIARQDTLDPRVVAHTTVHPVPPDLVVPAEQALAGGGRPIQWFKVIMMAVAVDTSLTVFSIVADLLVASILRTRRFFHTPSCFTILPNCTDFT
ncbi:hypothetical protein EDD85DRAFT_823880 [Armillaria nabsnona]|nr:hypothetical protein EDD85DRAFT_823880 [Armillaria nabsnona]